MSMNLHKNNYQALKKSLITLINNQSKVIENMLMNIQHACQELNQSSDQNDLNILIQSVDELNKNHHLVFELRRMKSDIHKFRKKLHNIKIKMDELGFCWVDIIAQCHDNQLTSNEVMKQTKQSTVDHEAV